MFSRVVTCHVNEGMDNKTISRIVELTEDIVQQYLEIYEKYAQEDNDRLEIILNPKELDHYMQPYKKKEK